MNFYCRSAFKFDYHSIIPEVLFCRNIPTHEKKSRSRGFSGFFNRDFFGIFKSRSRSPGFLGSRFKNPDPIPSILGSPVFWDPRNFGIFRSSPKLKIPIPNPRDQDSGFGIPKKFHPEANFGIILCQAIRVCRRNILNIFFRLL